MNVKAFYSLGINILLHLSSHVIYKIYDIGVGRFRILGGKSLNIGGGCGGTGGQIPSRHMTSY